MKLTDDTILVTGFGLQGHRFIADLITAHGKTIGYETDGRYGTSDWTLGGGNIVGDYEVSLHVLRNPFKTIRDWLACSKHEPLHQARKLTGIYYKGPLATELAYLWMEWNRRCHVRCQWTFRVEDVADNAHNTYGELCERAGIRENATILARVCEKHIRPDGGGALDLPDNIVAMLMYLYNQPIRFSTLLPYGDTRNVRT